MPPWVSRSVFRRSRKGGNLVSTSPYKGRGRRKAAGEGTAGGWRGYATTSYKGRGRREAAGEGTGNAPRAILLLLAAACALLFLIVAAPEARAHSRHEGSVEVFRGAAGPYDVIVEAVPSVGFLEATIVFETDAPGGALPYEPRVLVTAERGRERLGPASAVRVALNEYAVVFAPESAGEWSLLIAIDSPAGSASLDVPLVIAAPSASVPWTAIAAGVGLVLPILWLIFAPRKRAARAA